MKKIILFILLLLCFDVRCQTNIEVFESDDFLISYPLNWNLADAKSINANFAVTSPLSSNEDQFAENVNLIIQDLKGQNISLSDYAKLSREQLLTLPNGKIIESRRVNSGDKEFHQIIFEGLLQGRNLKMKQLYFMEKEKVYVLTFTAIKSEYDKYDEIASKIFNSFKLKE